MWCTAAARSAGVGFAVPMSMRRYICMESAETISPPSALASAMPSAVLPVAVGPVMTAMLSNGSHPLFIEIKC